MFLFFKAQEKFKSKVVNGCSLFTKPVPKHIKSVGIAELEGVCLTLCDPDQVESTGSVPPLAIQSTKYNEKKQLLTVFILVGEQAQALLDGANDNNSSSNSDQNAAFNLKDATNIQILSKKILQLASSDINNNNSNNNDNNAKLSEEQKQAAKEKKLQAIEAELNIFKNLV